jgi:hypothetical protein
VLKQPLLVLIIRMVYCKCYRGSRSSFRSFTIAVGRNTEGPEEDNGESNDDECNDNNDNEEDGNNGDGDGDSFFGDSFFD